MFIGAANTREAAAPAPLAYTVRQACAALGLGRTTFYSLIRAGQVRAVKSGRRTLIPVPRLRAYLANLPPLPAAPLELKLPRFGGRR